MPRRTKPAKKTACFRQRDAWALRPNIGDVFRSYKNVATAQEWSGLREFKELTPAQLARLEDLLLEAVAFARAGLSDILSGKRAKPHAWMLDIFVKDICDALSAVGIEPTMASELQNSFAQRLARDVGIATGVEVVGELFTQMQRAQGVKSPRKGATKKHRAGGIQKVPHDDVVIHFPNVAKAFLFSK